VERGWIREAGELLSLVVGFEGLLGVVNLRVGFCKEGMFLSKEFFGWRFCEVRRESRCRDPDDILS
jgi:hypothetical protein